MISFLPLFALFSIAAQPSTADQTSDALRVVAFVDAVRRGADQDARSMLAPGAFLGDYAQRSRASYEEFATYSRACQLRQIRLVNVRDRSRMPVGVEWQCRYPEPDRYASFWFEDNRISRVGWGPPPVVRAPSARP